MTLWFVKHGPDASHLWETQPFKRLKDAKSFCEKLPPTPIGGERPYKIEKFEYLKSAIYGDTVRISEVICKLV